MKVELKIKTDNLFDKVVAILEQARTNVVRSVNSNMVAAYWLIGREIVEEVQSGEKRAEYGKKIVENLSLKLQNRYKSGFSIANLKRFRQFYQVYSNRLINISSDDDSQQQLAPSKGANSGTSVKSPPAGSQLDESAIKPHPTGAEFGNSFNPNLVGHIIGL
jgi:hypothetical protein